VKRRVFEMHLAGYQRSKIAESNRNKVVSDLQNSVHYALLSYVSIVS
jgi:hypothetical protein